MDTSKVSLGPKSEVIILYKISFQSLPFPSFPYPPSGGSFKFRESK